MSAGKNRGLVFEALLDCIDEDVPVSDDTIRDWSRYVVDYLDGKGYVIRSKRDRT